MKAYSSLLALLIAGCMNPKQVSPLEKSLANQIPMRSTPEKDLKNKGPKNGITYDIEGVLYLMQATGIRTGSVKVSENETGAVVYTGTPTYASKDFFFALECADINNSFNVTAQEAEKYFYAIVDEYICKK